ncbi:unnamed protein product [Arabidopsis thaliana]|jgi:hypothetical protein|uniref:At1g80970 n=2 Tax=Arabidopsis thaliana TaxID=3702 RepID=Q1LYU7_ARATH|nr:XH domain-containing protein [Arabidopsis thaliana]NP_001321423.1 XH domain-containing protein [Arabidopsis thaliana]NP_178212.2 XH domain-containing protein [Arabidopsis thaliana]ABF19032.1 At1g80970 [Arabidopsis thaliana]AEE36475.1 XH domain-containing protein [Arabidopsis thaliana]ANM59027.1 XH domain-containing protein [Arabidopsis thaliana]ANM59028.1 XH domain-containing protein [Arabidopsis thaliana]CAD5317802.1 unnamed protein product [Arabidopsis thaliana]|eukprot:NP_001319435.1 XH domain-containing protein [Arabidopsis thaliana]
MDEFEGLKREVERLLDMVDSENSDCEEKIAIQEEVGDLPSSSVAVEFLEDEIDRKEEILLAASCTLLNMISGLDHSFDGNERDMGRLQVEEFRAACLGHKVLVNETEEQTFERADLIRTLWQKKILDSVRLAYLQGEKEMPFRPYDQTELEALKTDSGEKVYRLVRKGFREARVAVRTSVDFKPWDLEEGRECTLSELLDQLQALIRGRIRRHA